MRLDLSDIDTSRNYLREELGNRGIDVILRSVLIKTGYLRLAPGTDYVTGESMAELKEFMDSTYSTAEAAEALKAHNEVEALGLTDRQIENFIRCYSGVPPIRLPTMGFRYSREDVEGGIKEGLLKKHGSAGISGSLPAPLTESIRGYCQENFGEGEAERNFSVFYQRVRAYAGDISFIEETEEPFVFKRRPQSYRVHDIGRLHALLDFFHREPWAKWKDVPKELYE